MTNQEIHERSVELVNPCKCILGQIFEDYRNVAGTHIWCHNDYSLMHPWIAASLGFQVQQASPFEHDEYQRLERVWIHTLKGKTP